MSKNRKWEEHEITFLNEHWGDMDCKDIALKLGRTPRSVYLKGRKQGLLVGTNRKWEEHEITFLDEHWGTMDYRRIASRLNRTPRSVYLKGWKQDLGDPFLATDNISVNMLPSLFGVSGYRVFNIWIKKYNMPYRNINFGNKGSKRMFRIDEFWKWAEKHREVIDFSCLEKNILGAEPPWVNTKRRLDLTKSKSNKKKFWTKKDDDRLRSLLYEFKYTKREIAEILGRTECSIVCRIKTLNLMARPVEQEKSLWTKEEEDIAMAMHVNGLGFGDISDIMGKSTISISSKIYRMYKENKEAIADMIKGGMLIVASKEGESFKACSIFGDQLGCDFTSSDSVIEHFSKHLTGLVIADKVNSASIGEITEVKKIVDKNKRELIVALFKAV